MPHKPVLVQEVLECLSLKPGMTVVDGTVGNGGHALEILKVIGAGGRLIGLDQDPARLAKCREVLAGYPQVSLHHENFANCSKVLDLLNILAVDAVILDVGFCSDQMEDVARGFSFEQDGPLDMRMNPLTQNTARDLVNGLSQEELEILFRDYGNERWARRFAGAICEARRACPIETTGELVRVIEGSLPMSLRFQKGRRPNWARRHPATRVFQALRIAVNDELEVLKKALPEIWTRVAPGGRLAVITFHSLEDRIVKQMFKSWALEKKGRLVTKKPVMPAREEELSNPRSRSSKLRTVEKMP